MLLWGNLDTSVETSLFEEWDATQDGLFTASCPSYTFYQSQVDYIDVCVGKSEVPFWYNS